MTSFPMRQVAFEILAAFWASRVACQEPEPVELALAFLRREGWAC